MIGAAFVEAARAPHRSFVGTDYKPAEKSHIAIEFLLFTHISMLFNLELSHGLGRYNVFRLINLHMQHYDYK